MTISILLPLHSRASGYLDECISSIIDQTHTDWKLLIGINGGTDIDKQQAANKIKAYNDKRIQSITIKGQPGKIKALKTLVKICKDQYICLIDADDKWAPNKIEEQLKYIEKYNVVGTDMEYIGEHSGSPGLFLGKISDKMFSFQNPIIYSSVMCRRADLYYLDEKNEGIDDFALWIFLLQQEKTFFNVPEVLTYHRIHSKSFFNNKNEKKYWEIKNTLPKLTEEELKIMGKILDDKAWDL